MKYYLYHKYVSMQTAYSSTAILFETAVTY